MSRYPALLSDRLTPVNDSFAKLFLPEERFKRELIRLARIAPGQRVLDLGAGSGTLVIMLKQYQSQAQVFGVDGDPKILGLAQEKASNANSNVIFNVGNIVALPYCDNSFDRVLSSLVLSLLSREDKARAMRETYRVMRQGGEVYLADFGQPHTRWGRFVAPLIRRFEPIQDNLKGQLPILLGEAGFENVSEIARYATLFGTLSILSGRKPA